MTIRLRLGAGFCHAALFQCPSADQGREGLTTIRRRAKQDTASRREVDALMPMWSADGHVCNMGNQGAPRLSRILI